MKKILMAIFILGFYFLIPGLCLAAPAGNPAGPVILEGQYPTKFSLEAETVFDRKLESDNSGTPKFSGVFYTGKISVYTGHKLDIYGLVGTYQGKVKDFIGTQYIIETKLGSSFGLGASYVFHEWELANGIVRLGGDAKYRYINPDVDNVKWYRERIETTDMNTSSSEWQVSMGLAYQYKKFVPYAGLKYSDMRSQVKFNSGTTEISDKHLRAKNNVGIFYGFDYLVSDGISLNLEGRNIDEKAANIALNVRF